MNKYSFANIQDAIHEAYDKMFAEGVDMPPLADMEIRGHSMVEEGSIYIINPKFIGMLDGEVMIFVHPRIEKILIEGRKEVVGCRTKKILKPKAQESFVVYLKPENVLTNVRIVSFNQAGVISNRWRRTCLICQHKYANTKWSESMMEMIVT